MLAIVYVLKQELASARHRMLHATCPPLQLTLQSLHSASLVKRDGRRFARALVQLGLLALAIYEADED